MFRLLRHLASAVWRRTRKEPLIRRDLRIRADPDAPLAELIRIAPAAVYEWMRMEDCWVAGAEYKRTDKTYVGPVVLTRPDGGVVEFFGELPACENSLPRLREWVQTRPYEE